MMCMRGICVSCGAPSPVYLECARCSAMVNGQLVDCAVPAPAPLPLQRPVTNLFAEQLEIRRSSFSFSFSFVPTVPGADPADQVAADTLNETANMPEVRRRIEGLLMREMRRLQDQFAGALYRYVSPIAPGPLAALAMEQLDAPCPDGHRCIRETDCGRLGLCIERQPKPCTAFAHERGCTCPPEAAS